jgi:hypothetical protein
MGCPCGHPYMILAFYYSICLKYYFGSTLFAKFVIVNKLIGNGKKEEGSGSRNDIDGSP